MNTWYQEPTKVLIVDDDHDLLSLVTIAFRGAGFDTECASSGAAALEIFERGHFSLVVLDINMPTPNGLQVCSIIRRNSNVPILVLSARDEEQDLLEALAAGADTYLTKPFSPRTLIARSQALLRRADFSESVNKPADKFKLDINELVLRHPGGDIRLTKLETRVLRLLMLNAGNVVSAGDLMAEVWNAYRGANRNMLKQVIFRLRRKLTVNTDVQHALKSTAGGYTWTEVVDGETVSAQSDHTSIDNTGSVATL